MALAIGCKSDAEKLSDLKGAQVVACLNAQTAMKAFEPKTDEDNPKARLEKLRGEWRASDKALALGANDTSRATRAHNERMALAKKTFEAQDKCDLATRDLNNFLAGR